MKKIFLTLLMIFTGIIVHAQSITGTWQGNIDANGTQVPIVFHIVKDSTGKLIASFDSPNQHAFNLPCSDVIIKEDSIILMMAVLNGKYAGQLSADEKQIIGLWFQGGGALPLIVNKTNNTGEVKVQKRPQTPRPPYPYNSEEIEYYNADKNIKYGATITYPKLISDPRVRLKAPKYPAVILITGSGQQDRDETIFGHRSFAVIADDLTKKGFLVLRVDDRGIGKTTGNFAASTTADFVKDVEAGIDHLKTIAFVDKDKIGLIGHSEGGMIAPVVAGERSEIRFIVLLAGPGIPVIDLMREQAEAVSASQGNTPAFVKATGFLFDLVGSEINKGNDNATTHKNIRLKIDGWAKTLDTATRAKMELTDMSKRDELIDNAMAGMSSTWFKYFLRFNPQPYLQKLNCKVLALNGSKDVQVIAASNLAGIKASLKKSRSPKYDVIELPGLNHLFQTCIKCTPDEYGELEESFSPKALEIMGDWLQKNAK